MSGGCGAHIRGECGRHAAGSTSRLPNALHLARPIPLVERARPPPSLPPTSSVGRWGVSRRMKGRHCLLCIFGWPPPAASCVPRPRPCQRPPDRRPGSSSGRASRPASGSARSGSRSAARLPPVTAPRRSRTPCSTRRWHGCQRRVPCLRHLGGGVRRGEWCSSARRRRQISPSNKRRRVTGCYRAVSASISCRTSSPTWNRTWCAGTASHHAHTPAQARGLGRIVRHVR